MEKCKVCKLSTEGITRCSFEDCPTFIRADRRPTAVDVIARVVVVWSIAGSIILFLYICKILFETTC